MKKTLIIFLLISAGLFAQSSGSTGLSFLKLGFGARNIAMGDLGVVGTNDLTGFHYNPSLIAIKKKSQLSFTHSSMMQDLTSKMFAGSFSLFGLPFTAGVNTTSITGIEVRTKPGVAESEFNANYFYGSLSTAFEVYRFFYAGLTVKYLYESLYTNDATGTAFDFGLTYTGLYQDLTLGVSVRNIGSMNKLRNESTKLPSDFRLGAAYNTPLPGYNMDFTILAGVQNYFEGDKLHFHSGAEILYAETLALRVGYMSGYESKGLSAGFGIKWKSINIDYAFVPYKYALGDSHIIGFIFSFN